MKKATTPSTALQAVAPPDWPTLGLWPSTEPALDELRHRLQQAGCVFDLAVCRLHDGVQVNEALHRQALWALQAQIERQRTAHQREVARRHPNHVFHLQPLRWQAELATPSAWDVNSLRDPQGLDASRNQLPTNDFERLFAGFCAPPYGMRWQDGLFADLCTVVGLLPDEDVLVLDWVGQWTEASGGNLRCDWSNYFDEGRDWWGVWCLSIHNPQRQTLSLLAASTTD